ncbi:hypothetical protein KY348_06665 [Candidatus Woesearchaeota archaeon]|nr:hypothetical protein [Candidatus Woesearchaeota archaeon]
MINLSVLFSILSGLAFIAMVIVYFWQVKKGWSTPHIATWIVWLFATGLNLPTYFLMLHEGQKHKALPALLVFLGIVVIFTYTLIKKKWGKMGVVGIICLPVMLSILIFWQVTNNPVLANFAIQVVAGISFIPIVFGLFKKDAAQDDQDKRELKECPYAWYFGTLGYILMLIALFIDWQGWKEMIYPLVNGVGNGTVMVIVHFLWKKKIWH